MGNHITYVGLDVHTDGIVAAVAEGGIRGEVSTKACFSADSGCSAGSLSPGTERGGP